MLHIFALREKFNNIWSDVWKNFAILVILTFLFQVCIDDKMGQNKKGNKNLLK